MRYTLMQLKLISLYKPKHVQINMKQCWNLKMHRSINPSDIVGDL